MAATRRNKLVLGTSENVLQPTRLQGVKRLGLAPQPTKMQAKPKTIVTRAVLKNVDLNPKVATGLTGKVKTMKLISKKPAKVKPLPMEVDEEMNKSDELGVLPTYNDLVPIKVFPPGVSNVDTDFTDPQTCTDYVRDIYIYLRHLENSQSVKENFLSGSSITPKMRAVLINWLVEVKEHFRFLQETMFLTVALVDRYLSAAGLKLKRNKLQLLGVTALYLAIKYEETQIPDIEDLVFISENSCKATDIRSMEIEILKTLNFNLGRPLCINFLRRNSKVADVSAGHHGLAKLILESSMLEYVLASVNPSKIAAAALLLSLVVIDEVSFDKAWTQNLAYYSGYEVRSLTPLATRMATMLLGLKDCKLEAIYQRHVKYFSGLINKLEKVYLARLEKICLQKD